LEEGVEEVANKSGSFEKDDGFDFQEEYLKHSVDERHSPDHWTEKDWIDVKENEYLEG